MEEHRQLLLPWTVSQATVHGGRPVFVIDDVLWDGIRCEGSCCDRSPSWFSVSLPMPRNDDVELRICGHDGTDTEDTPIKLLEIFVQL